ncbi:MAG: 2-oxoacid:acceptor oxidoreductase family protein [Eubacteriales bacterium]|nr:2-oxoacid:acceptor oxidoreductase family protein [Eubacteriales bacterium]MDD4717233.1 2-oxoacid:acceptor oxidoreductase family protein [Eubacteriales bacterium]NCU26664.1 2-oxoacid:ferredoxin oxidoreductase subunit gamma [Candidatus Nomurabacteria bacterium]
MSEFSIIISGFGGQGVLSAGRMAALAAMLEGREVSWLPSYGPEMRGGTANCSVVISDEPIGSPLLSSCDVLIALNRPSLEKFEKTVKKGGTVILDSSLVEIRPSREDIRTIAVPASDTASENGNMAFAGVMLLGCLSGNLNCYNRDNFRKALEEILPAKKHDLIPLEMEIFDKGYHYV